MNYYNCKAGFLAIENNYLMSVYMTKPWVRLFAVGTGVAFAYLYAQILEYRDVPTAAEK